MQQLKLTILLFFCCLLINSKNIRAQTPYLERIVTINVTNLAVADVFKLITKQTSVVFSYTQFNDKQVVTLNYNKKPLRILLNELFIKLDCSYSIKDKYIILRCYGKKDVRKPPPAVLTGYLYNAIDSSTIRNASIYIKQSRHSALSDDYGYFSVTYSPLAVPVLVTLAKENFADTTLVIADKNKRGVTVYLKPIKIKQEILAVQAAIVKTDTMLTSTAITPTDTVKETTIAQKFNFWSKLKSKNANFRNINDTLFSKFSFALLPFLGTNKLLSINTVNKYALNLLAGNSKGIRVAEVAGLVNIDNGNVSYFQAAGLGSIVAGNVKGVQIGGLFNINSKATTGVQVGGILNYSYAVKGLQIGGLVNAVKKNMVGMQLAGLVNYSDSLTGLQLGGIANKVNKNVEGTQIAGISNYANTVNGIQFAGLVNSSKIVTGYQLSGLINHTRLLKGIQISPLNFSDTCTGVPIGLFNYVKKGYHRIELRTDELLFTTIGWHTGISKLHTILFGGICNISQSPLFTYGYGLGTVLNIKHRWSFTADITVQQIHHINNDHIELNLRNKLFLGLEYRVFPKFSIAIGPTYNILVSKGYDSVFTTINNKISDLYFYSTTDNNTVKMWAGATLSLKFL